MKHAFCAIWGLGVGLVCALAATSCENPRTCSESADCLSDRVCRNGTCVAEDSPTADTSADDAGDVGGGTRDAATDDGAVADTSEVVDIAENDTEDDAGRDTCGWDGFCQNGALWERNCVGETREIGDCESGNTCEDGECRPCPGDAEKVCRDGNLWRKNACGEWDRRVQNCEKGCEEGACENPANWVELYHNGQLVSYSYGIIQNKYEYGDDDEITVEHGPYGPVVHEIDKAGTRDEIKSCEEWSPSTNVEVVFPCEGWGGSDPNWTWGSNAWCDLKSIEKTGCDSVYGWEQESLEVVSWDWEVTQVSESRAAGSFDITVKALEKPIKGETLRYVGAFDTELEGI